MTAADHIRWQELASLDALGLLEGDEAAEWQAHLAECQTCRDEASQLADVVGAMAAAMPTTKPSPGLRVQLLSGLNTNGPRSDERGYCPGHEPGDLPLPDRKIVRAEQGEWQPTPFPGVELRQLSFDKSTGDATSLVRLAPGALYSPHRHASSEHCYILEGDLVFDDHTLQAGDYAVSAPGSLHTKSTTIHGCLLLIVNNVKDELLPHL